MPSVPASGARMPHRRPRGYKGELLAEITVSVPDGTRLTSGKPRDGTVGHGDRARLWRPVGEFRTIGVWRAEDEEEFH